MQSISAQVHFLSLAFLEAFSVTNVALLYRVGSCSLYPRGRSTWFLKLCCSGFCQHDEGGPRWWDWKDVGPISLAIWQQGKKKELISSDNKPTGLWKMSNLYPSLAKQGPFPGSWYQQEAKTGISLKGKIWLPLIPAGLFLWASGCWRKLERKKKKLLLFATCLT